MSKKIDLNFEPSGNMAAFGQLGFRYLVAGSNSVENEKFLMIQAIKDAVVSITNEPTYQGGDLEINNLAIPAGFCIYGNLKGITITSGRVIAYLKEHE